MAAHTKDDELQDRRELIWLKYDKFAPENHKVSAFITSKFKTQTCVERVSWKHVTPDQRQWYWDEFVKKYRWNEKDESEIRQVWYKNIADLYRQTIHKWCQKRKHPETVTEEQWEKWTVVWDSEDRKATTFKYKENKSVEPARLETGTTKHIAGSKCYAKHVQTLRKQLKKEPTSCEIFLHTRRRAYDTFVDKRSRLLNEQMKTYRAESMTLFEDVTMSDAPLSHEINRQFMITGGPKKGKLYGLSTIASTIYPEAMVPCLRGSAGTRQSLYALREEVRESQEVARAAIQRAKEAKKKAMEAHRECEELRSRVSSLEESVRLLFDGISRGSHSGYSSHGRGSSQVDRGSPYTDRSSQGSTGSPVGRGSPLDMGSTTGRSAHISTSFQGRASSNHMDAHLTRGSGGDDEYDDDETRP